MTPKQVEKYAGRHLAAGAGTVVVVGDAAQFAADIRKAHPQATLLESTTLDLDSPGLRPASGK
ncbi:hypothetical protein RHOFW104R3_05340 [Rhodanobacter denitrificans]|nr:hypothetical protein RHOFW104R3_05340 [Rhodanobacter denitrificans]